MTSDAQNPRLSANEACVRENLIEWIKMSAWERYRHADSVLHLIYGNMCSTDERADDGESLRDLFEARPLYGAGLIEEAA